MPTGLWSQDNFSKGELSPYMYARAQVQQYFDGLKQAQNVLTYPTGAAGKRFGTLYQATITGADFANEIFFETFQYLDECVYQLVFVPEEIQIYLEGILVATVVTVFDIHTIQNLSSTTLGAFFRVSGPVLTPTSNKPFDLKRTPNSANVITGHTGNAFTLTTAVTSGLVLPVRFTTTGTFPTTSPQIKAGVTYFLKYTSTSTAEIYETAYNAKFGIDVFVISADGTGTNNLIAQNTWSFSTIVLKNLPVYDFDGGYDAITFSWTATTGILQITASAPIFGTRHVGGAFFASGGSGRIIIFTDSTHVTLSMATPFDAIGSVIGSLALLAEPAWSNARGWPEVVSSYQNRALFANSESLPNGFWASVINDYSTMTNLTNDDDDGISWYPSSNAVNVIRFIVPFRSITVHTNSGIYSSPLSEIAAITPNTFTLQLQDSTPATVLQPQAIDNQIIMLSGNDVHTMLWDGINNAYTSNIVSVASEQVIRDPVDEAAFADLTRAGSRYVFIINDAGSMAVYQTLQSEQVSGFTPQIMEQSYGNAFFRQVGSSSDGRCWFIAERDQATALPPIAITGFTAKTLTDNSTLTAIASNFDPTEPTAITFTTTGTLPATNPVTPGIAVQTYYWAIGVDADTFWVYESQEDALADANAISFTSAGTNSNVIGWPVVPVFTLEELSQDVKLDCAVYYNDVATDTINTGALFNAQEVKMLGATEEDDGYFGFSAIGVNNEVVFEAHGDLVEVEQAYIGFPINYLLEPMPIATPPGANTSLTKPTHIRSIRFMFNNTIGGTINGVPITLKPFDQAEIGQPPIPGRGIYEIMTLSGWDDNNQPSFVIEHDEPFNIELIGVFYTIDI